MPLLLARDKERVMRRLQSTQLQSQEQDQMIAEFDNGILREAKDELSKLRAERITLLQYATTLSSQTASAEDSDLEDELMANPYVQAQLEELFLKVKILEPQIKHAQNHVVQLQGRRQLVVERKRQAARESTFNAMLDTGAALPAKGVQKMARQNADRAALVKDQLEEQEDLTNEYAIETVDTLQTDAIADAAKQAATDLMRKSREKVRKARGSGNYRPPRLEGEEQPPPAATPMPDVPTRPLNTSTIASAPPKKKALVLRTD